MARHLQVLQLSHLQREFPSFDNGPASRDAQPKSDKRQPACTGGRAYEKDVPLAHRVSECKREEEKIIPSMSKNAGKLAYDLVHVPRPGK